MFGFRYLSDEKLQGFNHYKYSCIETNPVTLYLFQPWWRAVVQVVPLWVAPNLLTLLGFLLHCSILLLFTYYDYDYKTTGNANRDPIPSWVWLYSSIAHFSAHTLDGIDGKQARRTNSSSPLGELFDHGLDSIVCVFIPLILYSIVGQGQYGIQPHEGYWPALALIAGFYWCHWEKYITGTVYLPWSYDFGELVIPIVYAITGVFGVGVWQFNLLPGLSCATAFSCSIIFGAVLSIPLTLYNISEYFKSSSNFEGYSTIAISTVINSGSSTSAARSSNQHQRSLTELVLPLFPCFLLCVVFTFWTFYSPTDIVSRSPRLFLFTAGIVFSNATCRLIVSQMSGHVAEYINLLSIPLILAMVVSFCLPQYELMILYGVMITVLSAHVHYGCSVVNELCNHFNIYAFSLTKPSR